MNYEADIFIKDEGDEIMTVCFQTPRGIKALKSNPYISEKTYGSDDYKKWDVDATLTNYRSIETFAKDNKITFDSDVDVDILSTVKWA